MGCPNCAAKLAELGPGWWAAFFIVGLFGMLGGFLLLATKQGFGSASDQDHLEVKYAILDCEDDDWASSPTSAGSAPPDAKSGKTEPG